MRAGGESGPVAAPLNLDTDLLRGAEYHRRDGVVVRPVHRDAPVNPWRYIDGLAREVATVGRLTRALGDELAPPLHGPQALEDGQVDGGERERAGHHCAQVLVDSLEATLARRAPAVASHHSPPSQARACSQVL